MMFEYQFMQNALIAILLITPIFGILGTMIVNNKMAFFSDALGHSAFTGIALGVILGVQNTLLSMIVFGVIFALLLNWIRTKSVVSMDTIISVFSSFGMAIGLAILSLGGNFAKYNSLLIGDILSITRQEIIGLLLAFLIVLIFWYVCFNQLHAMSINRSLAKTKGIFVELIDPLFVILMAVVVMLSIQWVGLLIINALLILPAASARNIAYNMRTYHLYSIIISMLSGSIGLVLSYYLGIATGPMIVIVASLIFFLTLLLSKKKRR